MKALDYMIEHGKYQYHCDPWYRSPGDEHYTSMKNVNGQVNYRGEIFVVTHRSGEPGHGGMDEGTPNSVSILRVRLPEESKWKGEQPV